MGSHRRKDRVLLEMPGDERIQAMIQDLAQVVGWKELADIPPDDLCLETEEGEKLPGDRTLSEAGVSGSDLLFLGAKEPQTLLENIGAKPSNPGNAEAPGNQPAVPERVMEILRQPRLAGPRGPVFLLGKPRTVVGRAEKGSVPDIDLAEWDPKMIASRKHALIEQTEDGFVLRPEKTTNGTFINGVEVPAGESRILREGDRIQFGFQGLEMIFRQAE